MNYGEKINERLYKNYTITVKSLDGVEFDLDSNMFEGFCNMVVRISSEDMTYVSTKSLEDLCRWVRTIKLTNCGEIWDGINNDLKNSGYKKFVDGLIESASEISVESHKFLP